MASSSRSDGKKTVCAHPEIVVECRFGDSICTDCGTIIGDKFVDIEDAAGTVTNETSSTNDSVPMGSSYRALKSAYKEMDDVIDRIFLPKSIRDGARALFKKVLDGKLLTGHSHLEMICACIYLSCREQKAPRTYHEISLASGIDKHKYSGCVETIKKELNFHLDPIKPVDFISRFCAKLCLPFKFETIAAHVAQKASELGIVSSRSAITVSAAVIYLVSQASGTELQKKKKEIGLVTGIKTANTISECYKLMLPQVAELFPTDFKFATPIELLPEK